MNDQPFQPRTTSTALVVRRSNGPIARPTPSASQPSQLLEYWTAIRAKFGWICLLSILGAGVGWLVAAFQPAMYQARTVLDIRSLNENFLNSREGSSIGSTTGNVLPESYIQTEIKILQSELLRKRALSRLGHLQYPPNQSNSQLTSSFWQSLLGRFDVSAIPYKTLIADAGNRIKVRAVGNTRIVEILCDARDGQLAAAVCNGMARTYIEYNLESRHESTKETGEWLQSQLDVVRERLAKAENALKDSSNDASFNDAADPNDNLAQEKLRQIQDQLSRVESERIAVQSDYDVALTRSAEAMPMSIDSGSIRDDRAHLSELNRKLAELTETMTPEHYLVREVQQQIAETKEAIERERGNVLSRLRGNLDAAERREAMLRAEYKQQSADVAQQGNKSVQYNMTRRDVDSERRLYETLLQKVDEVGLATAMHTSTISVVDPAVPPALPYSPNQVASVGVGLFGGACIGLVFSFTRLRADRSLHGPGEASYHLQLRELGVIPAVQAWSLPSLFGRMSQSFTSRMTARLGLRIQKQVSGRAQQGESAAQVQWQASSSTIKEAFLATMSSLLFAHSQGIFAQVIVMTSPDAGDGKTTVATNLAMAMAHIGQRVVVIDGDLRKPTVHKVFGISQAGGLASLLDNENSIEDWPVENLVRSTHLRNLFVIPTHVASEGTIAKLHSERFRILLDRLKTTFDIIVIDSPPMLHLSDARVLGSRADGVVLVFRARRTTIDDALAAYNCLVQDGTRVLGTVLNDWNPRKAATKYASYKSYLRAAS